MYDRACNLYGHVVCARTHTKPILFLIGAHDKSIVSIAMHYWKYRIHVKILFYMLMFCPRFNMITTRFSSVNWAFWALYVMWRLVERIFPNNSFCLENTVGSQVTNMCLQQNNVYQLCNVSSECTNVSACLNWWICGHCWESQWFKIDSMRLKNVDV